MLDDVMVRRLKDDLREVVGGFPKREGVQVDINGLPGIRCDFGSLESSISSVINTMPLGMG